MSTSVGENVTQRPETSGLIDYGEKLRELHTIDTDIADRLRPQVWSVAHNVVSSLVDPGQQEAAQLYAGMVEWQMLGKPGDSLPEGLLLFRDEDDDIVIAPNTDIPYLTGKMPEAVGRQFDRAGMADIGKQVSKEIDKNGAEIKATLVEFLRQSPEYQLLASFDRPERQVKDEPLNPYWRQVRQTQIEHEVRTKYGINHGEDFIAGSPAQRELGKRLYHMDDETKPQLSKPIGGKVGLHRARNYLTPFVVEALNEGKDEHEKRTLKGIYFENEWLGGVAIGYKEADGKDEEDEFWDFAGPAGYLLSERIYTGHKDIQHISGLFAGLAIEQIFHPGNRNIIEALEDAIETAVEITEDDMRGMLPGGHMTSYPGGIDFLLKAPQAEVIEDGEIPAREWYDRTWENVFRRNSQFSTRGELLRDQRKIEGVVRKYGPDNFRVAARLILKTLCLNPEIIDGQEDLVIELWNHDNETEPFIPGYKLTTKDGYGRFGFEVDSNGDQYARCNVPVNKQRRAKLAGEYRTLGLNTLADKLEAQSRFVRLPIY